MSTWVSWQKAGTGLKCYDVTHREGVCVWECASLYRELPADSPMGWQRISSRRPLDARSCHFGKTMTLEAMFFMACGDTVAMPTAAIWASEVFSGLFVIHVLDVRHTQRAQNHHWWPSKCLYPHCLSQPACPCTADGLKIVGIFQSLTYTLVKTWQFPLVDGTFGFRGSTASFLLHLERQNPSLLYFFLCLETEKELRKMILHRQMMVE